MKKGPLSWVVAMGLLLVANVPSASAEPMPLVAPRTYTVTYGPLSIGEYCRAQVNYQSSLGMYEASGLICYAVVTAPRLTPVGTGDPIAACRHLSNTTNRVKASRGGSGALVCEIGG